MTVSDKPVNLALFDLDGTLFRSTSILPQAYRDGIRELSDRESLDVDVPDESAILAEVGNPAREIYENLFPELDERHRDQLSQLILERLSELIRDGGGELIEDVEPVLGSLTDRVELGLVTNARVPYMEAVVDTYSLDRFFERMRCIGMVESDQKVTLVEGMLDYFNADPGETVVIGDRRSDYEAATGAGTRFIGCQFGYSPEKEFPDDHVIESFSELPEHPFLSLSNG